VRDRRGVDIAQTGPESDDRGLHEGEEWVASLRSHGAERATALARLHALLLRGARFEVSRRSAAFSQIRG
jgi:hypothetical protein